MDVATLNVRPAMAALSFAWTAIRSDWRHLDGGRCSNRRYADDRRSSGQSVLTIMDGEQAAIGSQFILRCKESAARSLSRAALSKRLIRSLSEALD